MTFYAKRNCHSLLYYVDSISYKCLFNNHFKSLFFVKALVNSFPGESSIVELLILLTSLFTVCSLLFSQRKVSW